MRLCIGCHQAHHNRSSVVPLAKLLDIHFAYAFEKMGVRAHGYLTRLYGGEDERLDDWLKKSEEGEDERTSSSADAAAV